MFNNNNNNKRNNNNNSLSTGMTTSRIKVYGISDLKNLWKNKNCVHIRKNCFGQYLLK